MFLQALSSDGGQNARRIGSASFNEARLGRCPLDAYMSLRPSRMGRAPILLRTYILCYLKIHAARNRPLLAHITIGRTNSAPVLPSQVCLSTRRGRPTRAAAGRGVPIVPPRRPVLPPPVPVPDWVFRQNRANVQPKRRFRPYTGTNAEFALRNPTRM